MTRHRGRAWEQRAANEAWKDAKKQKRKSASARGYGADWQALRGLKIREVLNDPAARCPLCGLEFEPHNSKAIHLDHIKRLADGGARLDPANWRAVHGRCHSRMTAQEDRAKERGYRLGVEADGLPSDPCHPFNKGAKT